MAAKVSKLEEQFKRDAPREKQKDGSYSDIFSGVSIYVNGYTGNVMQRCLYISTLPGNFIVLTSCKSRGVMQMFLQRNNFVI